MEVNTEGPNQPAIPKTHPNRNRRRNNRNPDANTNSSGLTDSSLDPSSNNGVRDNGRTRKPPRDTQIRNPRPPTENRAGNVASVSSTTGNNGLLADSATAPNRGGHNSKRRNPPRPSGDSATAASPNVSVPGARSRPPQARRHGAKFNAGLTEPSVDTSSSSSSTRQRYRSRESAPKGDDLTSILTHDLSTPPYPDCPICFAAIHPGQPTWSCSPSIFNLHSGDDSKENESSQCCWTTFHLKCIRSWASKSVKELVDAWRARGEERQGEWRCPGCQSKREMVPNGYWCFCGATAEPKPPRLATPHSCANACSRPRACGHPCPLACHPGPCPPCQVTTQLPCYCGKQIQSFRCSHLAPGSFKADLSCTKACGKKLGCSNHICEDVCHPGECQKCPVRDVVKCYCGKEEHEVACGEGEDMECTVAGEAGNLDKWVGRFQCENNCNRPFDCGIHFCLKACHPPSPTPQPCPRSQSLVTHCPCGKNILDSSSASSFPPDAVISRSSCSDPIPTCNSTCMRPLEGCSHVCSSKCHTGPCPPCTIILVRPCRCGASTKEIQCSSLRSGAQSEILCDRQCPALRACGRHQCNRVCCPLASLAGPTKGKGKKRGTGNGVWDGFGMDETGLHECDLVCGKLLGCGNHRCENRDHRGICAPCLRSSFEEMICYCGRTILEPPIPCGTRINCNYPCSRPPLACGHPKTQHSCHEDPSTCPPCPFLANKLCACGKKTVGNVRCSQEKVSCGATCGKLLGCGFHHCDRLCHGDDCGTCTSACGKSRKLCLPANHPCTLPCHAPSACSESEPCRAAVTLTCPCGRIRQSAPCGRSMTNPGREATLQVKCSSECLVAKRNARLAEALGISAENREKSIVYNDDLTAFGKANAKFVTLAEKTFADFVTSEKKTQVLPHMPPERRKFIHDLAAIYRMDVQMVDQEPHRSVQLIRRVDTRVPNPLLSSTIVSSGPGLGKLTDLRAPAQPLRTSRPPSATPSRISTPVGSSAREWTSVVAKPTASLAQASSSWRAPIGNSRPSAARVPAGTAGASNPPAAPAEELTGVDVPDSWEDDV